MIVDRNGLKELVKELILEVQNEEVEKYELRVLDSDILVTIHQLLQDQLQEIEEVQNVLENNIYRHKYLINKIENGIKSAEDEAEIYKEIDEMFLECVGHDYKDLVDWGFKPSELSVIIFLQECKELIN